MEDVLFDLSAEKPEQVKPEPKIYTSGGKGKKQCQNTACGVFVGVRTKNCPVCDTEFVKKLPQKASLNPDKDAKSENSYGPTVVIKTSRPYDSVILIPAGLCPIVPTVDDLTAEGIVLWAEAVRDWGLTDRKHYLTGEAITFYARYTFGIFTDEYKMIRDVLKTWEESSDGIR